MRRAQPDVIENYKRIASDPEFRRKQSEKLREYANRPDVVAYRDSAEAKESQRTLMKAVTSTPKARKNYSDAAKLRWADPVYRANMLAKRSAKHQDPEYRNRMSIAVKAALSKRKENNEITNSSESTLPDRALLGDGRSWEAWTKPSQGSHHDLLASTAG